MTVWAAASIIGHPFLSKEFLAIEREKIANDFLPAAESWVWESDGRVVGFVSLLGNEIGGIFVDPSFHGKGIGRGLLNHVRGIREELEVEVFQANAIGRSFYERNGFLLLEERKDPETGLAIIRLQLTSNQAPSSGTRDKFNPTHGSGC